jgi:hypothetical protein
MSSDELRVSLSKSGPRTLAEVPDEDLAGSAFADDPAGEFDRARARSWIVRTLRGYEVLDYEVVREMAVDRRLDSIGPDYYRNLDASDTIMWYATEASLPMIEGARHDRIRGALQKGFTRRRIDGLRPRMREIANRLVVRLAAADPFDVVAGFTHVYPLEVMCALMGVPQQDVDRFNAWTVDLGLLARFPLQPHMRRIDEAIAGLRKYLRGLVAQRTINPGDDFVSDLVAVQASENVLTESELEGALLNLLFAAHDTTRYQFGWVVQLLVQHGGWTSVGRNRELIASAVDEAMRLEPALHIMLRKATVNVEYRGLIIPAGTLVVMNIYAANHDPEVFPDPHRYDLSRANAGRHLGFGHGGHLCLGHALARAEMAEALAVFLDRFPELHVAGEPWYESGFSSMRGAERIPISAHPAPPGTPAVPPS